MATARERAEQLVAGMTLEQKIAQLHGAMDTVDIYGADSDQLRIERHVAAIDELGIPRFRITNGPVGVGMGDGTPSPPATSLPMTIGLAAGFDPTWRMPTATSSARRRRRSASTSWRAPACACTGPRSPVATSSTSPRTRT
jgi:hypothetical protein